MPSYRLDELGWFEFEQLVQTLLKARLGLGVEAWGGRGDWGRDAYFEGMLKYPTLENTQGPFLFQCKFVEEANAPGAHPERLLLDSIRKESNMISERLSGGKSWPILPKHYILLTNSPASPGLRIKINKHIKDVLPICETHIHDGNDLNSWLLLTPEVVRKFPQLFTLRDLQDLLAETVHADILNRSQAAIDLAQAHARVFVPTGAYVSAQERLEQFNFVVLIGPPEMGKTTIGRIIALSQLSVGWESLECRSPKEVLSSFKKDRKQVFVADDFFGRTEYEPMRVSEWQAELAHILPRLDSSHWLILTSRAHLLEFAKTNLDIDGQNHRFPDLGEVIVDASKLTSNEKARILYRHAKTSLLNDKARTVIKQYADKITSNPHFTPERIRRLVEDVMPKLVTIEADVTTEIDTQIHMALTNPTKQMRVSFRRLPSAYRWLLYAMLDVEQRSFFTPGLDSLKAKYLNLCPPEKQQSFEMVIKDLSEAFIRKFNSSHFQGINWVHPSCRDLAIEELSSNRPDRERFLSHCTDPGLLLALSLAGGDKGERALPLLQEPQDWDNFTSRAIAVVESKPNLIHALWLQYEVLASHANDNRRLDEAAVRVKRIFQDKLIPSIRKKICVSEFQRINQCDIELLGSFLTICGSLTIAPEIDLSPVWKECQGIALSWECSNWVIYQDTETPRKILTFLKSISENFEADYKSAQSSGVLDSIIDPIFDRIQNEATNADLYEEETHDDNEERKRGYGTMAEICSQYSSLPGLNEKQRSILSYASTEFESVHQQDNPSRVNSNISPRSESLKLKTESLRATLAEKINEIRIADLFKDL